MKRLLLTMVLLYATATACVAAPSAADAKKVKPFVPKGYALVDVVPGFGADRVAILSGGDHSRVMVLHGGKAIWLVTDRKTPDFPAPVQGGAGEKIGQLVYTANVQKQPLLFVTCYMADAYTLYVFKPDEGGYRQIFSTSSMNTPKVDRKTGRITADQILEGNDSASKVAYAWRKGKYVKEGPPKK